MPRDEVRTEQLERLFHGVLTLKETDECYRFFLDLCTVGELHAMAQRFRVAEMLAAGATYEETARESGASPATISRVRRFLDYGNDGYRLVIGRLQAAKAPDDTTGSDESTDTAP